MQATFQGKNEEREGGKETPERKKKRSGNGGRKENRSFLSFIVSGRQTVRPRGEADFSGEEKDRPGLSKKEKKIFQQKRKGGEGEEEARTLLKKGKNKKK